MKKLLTITLLCLSLISFGQEDIEKKEKLNVIIFSPLNIIDPVNPTIQFGYQRKLNSKWEGQAEVGLLLKKSPWDKSVEGEFDYDDSLSINHKGFRLRAELKYYLLQNNVDKHYISLELFYLKNNTRTTETFIHNKEFFYQDFFLNKKKKYGLNLKYGIKFLMGKSFFFESHIGVGVSFREIRHENRGNIDDALDVLEWWDDNKIIGNKWVINFPLNGKVGYQF